MKQIVRAAATAAVLAASGLIATTASAAGPPQNFDLDILSQFNANNSYDTVRHLAVDIGPRRSGLPEEDEAAEYLAGRLAAYGFEPIPGQTQMVFQYALAGNRPAAKVTSPDTALFNGPNWQLSFAANSKITGTDYVTAPVLWVNSGWPVVGAILVAACALLGATLLGGSDDTVGVWAARRPMNATSMGFGFAAMRWCTALSRSASRSSAS